MIYVATPAPKYVVHRMTLEELFSGKTNFHYTNRDGTNTITYRIDSGMISPRMSAKVGVDICVMMDQLAEFNKRHADLFDGDRHALYKTFYIPKKSHGYRRIDAPKEELSTALRELKRILECYNIPLYHTAAFAYIRKRSTLDAVKRHQANESNWFGKYDLSNFFGNTTFEFVKQQFSMVYPFNLIMQTVNGRQELLKALDLAFLDGGLPQGTPLSPLITNIVMMPIDHELSKRLHQFKKQRLVYTRYADDFLVSSVYNFDVRAVEREINDVLAEFDAPYRLNAEKTRYGSRSGQNWNLGLMLNKDNQITVGSKRKRELKAAITSYILDRKHGVAWDIGDLQVLQGNISYCNMVEPAATGGIIAKLNTKFNADVMRDLKIDLKGGEDGIGDLPF